MKIHSNIIEASHLRDASALAGTSLERWDRSGSRDRDHKWDVILSGESGRKTNQRWGMGDDYAVEAATWDQWGIFLAYLFEVDPDMVCGSVKYPAYASAEDFHLKTGGRFDKNCVNPGGLDSYAGLVLSQSSPDYKITAHRWEYDFETSRPLSGTRAYYCKGHSAKRNKRAGCHATRVI